MLNSSPSDFYQIPFTPPPNFTSSPTPFQPTEAHYCGQCLRNHPLKHRKPSRDDTPSSSHQLSGVGSWGHLHCRLEC